MKLSKRARYGLRLMVELAYHQDKGMIQLNEIAKKEDISMKYLSLLIIPLRSAGLVQSTRGAHGGYVLAKAAKDITVGQIVNILEGDLTLVECTTNPAFCKRISTCVTSNVWKQLSRVMIDFLNSITLADLARDMNEKIKNMGYLYQI